MPIQTQRRKLKTVNLPEKFEKISARIIARIIRQKKNFKLPIRELKFSYEEAGNDTLLPFCFSLVDESGQHVFKMNIDSPSRVLDSVADLQYSSSFEKLVELFGETDPDVENVAYISRYVARYECMLTVMKLKDELIKNGIPLGKKCSCGITDMDHELDGGEMEMKTSLSDFRKDLKLELRSISSKKLRDAFLYLCYGELPWV